MNYVQSRNEICKASVSDSNVADFLQENSTNVANIAGSTIQ